MVQVIQGLLHGLQSILVPLCFVGAWGFVLLLGWSVVGAIAAGMGRARLMHRIPCSSCQFFTGDYRLKCTVHPAIALSERAIGCWDYHNRSSQYGKFD